MTLDDGRLTLCQIVDSSQPGGMPTKRLAPRRRVWYASRTIGYNRRYVAAQAGQAIDRLVRVWLWKPLATGMWYAVIGKEQYRIDAVATLTGDDGLRYMDLTMVKLEDMYEVEKDEEGNEIDKQNPAFIRRKL